MYKNGITFTYYIKHINHVKHTNNIKSISCDYYKNNTNNINNINNNKNIRYKKNIISTNYTIRTIFINSMNSVHIRKFLLRKE